MIKPENKLVEDRWYRVQLEDDLCSSRYLPTRVMGKYHFIGYLIIHVNGKLIFNLEGGEGSVILPFENIKTMVPYYDPIKEKTEDYSWEI